MLIENNSLIIKMNKIKSNISNDVAEGRSVFIRGISKSATQEILKSKLGIYGELKGIKLCIYKETGISKGTGFAEFKSKEAAAECIESNEDPACKEDFLIDGQFMQCHLAVQRNDPKIGDTHNPFKRDSDKRNIYLSREGVVREGTRAADGVSKFDLSVRVQRELMKRKLLKNLHNFISKTRLYVDNIPQNLSDNKLRNIFINNSPDDAVIDECRIMKERKNISENGQSTNKGFGFINFTKHIHALAALREVNNNPEIFEKNKRPIVEFSIENKALLNAKEKRNQKCIEKVNEAKSVPDEEKHQDCHSQEMSERTPISLNNAKFVGGKSKKGMKLATHIGPKVCKKSGKISRNQINNRVRKQRKNQKKRITRNKVKPGRKENKNKTKTALNKKLRK